MKKFLFLALTMGLMCVTLTSCRNTEKLEKAVSQLNNNCPVYAGFGITMNSISIEGGNVIIRCLFDEDELGVRLSSMDNATTRAAMKTGCLVGIKSGTDDVTTQLVEQAKKLDYNIIYRYISSNSGYTLDILLPSNDL